MTHPKLVLIAGGREVGGVQAFAQGLAQGFARLGIEARVVPNRGWWAEWRHWRDPAVMKILSTTSVFLGPLMRGTLSVAHGFPRIDGQGLLTTWGVITSLKLAQHRSTLVSVSHYVSLHLSAVFGIHCAGVIHNPLSDAFHAPVNTTAIRALVTYVGRLHPVKNVDRLLPAALQLLDEDPSLALVVVGEGPERPRLEAMCAGRERVSFAGTLSSAEVQALLARTQVFFSGCETEALGISYLEALSQGCAVVMPACGGGLELAPEQIGQTIFPFPLSFDQQQVLQAFRAARQRQDHTPPALEGFKAERVAGQYLAHWQHAVSCA